MAARLGWHRAGRHGGGVGRHRGVGRHGGVDADELLRREEAVAGGRGVEHDAAERLADVLGADIESRQEAI